MDNSTLTIMEQRVAGLRATLDGLREDERLFQRAAGLKVQQEKDHPATLELEARLTAGKKELADLLDQKARAMQTTATALAQKMGQMLPYGQAVFSVDDEGKVFLGWDLPNHGLVAHGGLSGGQRTMFDGALAYALARQDRKNPVILLEGAELGPEISTFLAGIAEANVGTQIIVCTCHDPAAPVEGWTVVSVEEGAR